MALFLTLIGVIIFTCVLLNNASFKLGVPMLLAFILLGIAFGNNGFIPLEFDNPDFADEICTIALIFIMFYGGFGTNWKSARGVAVEAGLLATVGVIITAGLTGVFCHYMLKWNWVESLLMGSVVSSTDAASVFSILRSRKLGLKNNTAPLLEIESGSNDPCSFMLTIIMLSMLNGEGSGWHIAWMVFSQIAFGAGFGLIIATAAIFVIKRISFATSGFDSLFIISMAIFSYAVPSLVGGNGYLSAYIVGICLGNSEFHGRKDLVNFFDGFTGLMQVLIFFLLGLLARPAMMHKVILPAMALFAVMMLISRPISIALVLAPFRKYKLKQQALISFVGLRGAASIVFAIIATTNRLPLQHDIFSVVFCIVLMSIALQGTLIPFVAKKLDMIDPDSDVMKTFSDFSDETNLQLSEVIIKEDSPWNGRTIKSLGLPKYFLLCSIIHPDGTRTVPSGSTVLNTGDHAIMCTKAFRNNVHDIKIVKHPLSKHSKWIGTAIKDYPYKDGAQVVLIRRADGSTVIPNGKTVLAEGDTLYINKNK